MGLPGDRGPGEGGSAVKTIVVGVDGSAHGDGALDFALEEAALRGTELRVVCAWEIPPGVAFAAVYTAEALDAFRAEAQSILNEALARVAGSQPAVKCLGKVVEAAPADALLQEARDAGMVVVGSRGRGGFASLLLCSVSQQVVHHAACPVVVVR